MSKNLIGLSPDPLPNSISQSKLKTSIGEVSATTTALLLVLAGGEYGFYPQIKMSDTVNATEYIAYMLSHLRSNNTGLQMVGWGTYATKVIIGNSAGYTIYMQQRYITASGIDLWVFLLLDKITKKIISGYQAPDHPAYGNGGDFEKLSHPFGSYDNNIHEIVLIDKETCLEIKSESKNINKSILTLINEDYQVKIDTIETYQPLHTGQFIDEKIILLDKIPDYITVRKLIKK